MERNDIDWQGEIDQGPDANDADLLDDERVELLKCPSCGNMMSEFAQQCPHCKDWILDSEKAGPFRGRSWWWIALAIIGIAMFFLYFAI